MTTSPQPSTKPGQVQPARFARNFPDAQWAPKPPDIQRLSPPAGAGKLFAQNIDPDFREPSSKNATIGFVRRTQISTPDRRTQRCHQSMRLYGKTGGSWPTQS